MKKVRFELDIRKSTAENASSFYELSKKSKRKLEGVDPAISKTKKEIASAEKKEFELKERQKVTKRRKKKWFEGYHWFVSSDGVLVVGGRDARSNDSLVKKHMDKSDKHVHASIQGSPHVVVKLEGKSITDSTAVEAANFAAAFSKAWREGLTAVDVSVQDPSQVTKETKSGESMGAGAFMIYGKRDWHRDAIIDLSIGIIEYEGASLAMCGPSSAVEKNCKVYLKIKQGKGKKSDTAKQVQTYFKKKVKDYNLVLDDIMSVLPSGGIDIRI